MIACKKSNEVLTDLLLENPEFDIHLKDVCKLTANMFFNIDDILLFIYFFERIQIYPLWIMLVKVKVLKLLKLC